jgi:hypothetical protein
MLTKLKINRSQVWDQVCPQVRDQVELQVKYQVWDQVDLQVRDQVWFQVKHHACWQTGYK